MAAGWIQALKVIPWGNVIEAAPGLAKSARGFFKRTQEAAATADSAAAPPAGVDESDPLAPALRRIAALESRLVQAAERQQAAAELLDSLAAQNARLVQTVDALRKRTKALVIAACVLAVALIGAFTWIASIAR